MQTSSIHRAARALLLALPCATLAQTGNEPSDSDTRSLEAVTVNAQRSLEQRFFAAGSLVVVDRADIERLGAFSIAEVLQQLPGVQVTTNANGSVEIRMRGMDRNATQLLVDGQRVGSARGQLPLDQLPAELVERIEVVRAPSAEFAGATGGTLNIVLRQATAKRETNIRITDNRVWGRDAGQAFFSRTGPLVTLPAEADGQPTSAPWSYFVAASANGLLLGSDTQRSTQASGATLLQSDATGRFRRNDYTLLPRVQGRLGAADQLTLRATLTRSHFGGGYESAGRGDLAGGAGAFDVSESNRYQRQYLQAGADWAHRFAGSKLETTLTTSHASDRVEREGIAMRDGAADQPYAFDDDRRDRFATFSSKLTGTASPLLWSLGVLAEQRRLDVATRYNAGDAQALQARVQRTALWGQNEWELPGQSTLTAGLRGEQLAISGDARITDRTTRFLQPSLHLRVPVGDTLQWRANLARITRNPGIWDLVDRRIPSQGGNSLTNPDTLGNPALRPERSWTLDTGFEKRLSPQGQAGLNLFVRSVSDAIAQMTLLQGGRWTEQRSNVGDALVWGLEADVRSGLAWAGFGRDWTLAANASLLQSRMQDGPNEGKRIPGQARYTASVNIAKPIRRNGGLFGGATLQLTGPAALDTAPGLSGRTSARAALDVYIGSVVPGWGYWRIGLFNITDAPFGRERGYSGAGGQALTDRSRMLLTPRAYLTVGTQF